MFIYFESVCTTLRDDCVAQVDGCVPRLATRPRPHGISQIWCKVVGVSSRFGPDLLVIVGPGATCGREVPLLLPPCACASARP